ncbi:hypothetical protein RIF23_00625 [Lipingzhangella sp. LS1_29]|uniref:Uncharacterized protein n=1 Tax=Lipingzhangella rawalii TaxID=2055835 RepID=A0ABU2H0G3_9ACTN|nr:hypothetical protein [Lipingzhangella rawalii]MDS1268792.1 hypothetical protein [Lipingzhangella rawalii]
MYCSRLRGALGRRRGQVTGPTIWPNEDSAAFARQTNGGNATPPTTAIHGAATPTPTPDMVLRHLRDDGHREKQAESPGPNPDTEDGHRTDPDESTAYVGGWSRCRTGSPEGTPSG